MTPTGSVELTWDPETNPGVTGYQVYWGTASGVYTMNADVGLTATPMAPEYTVTGLTCGPRTSSAGQPTPHKAIRAPTRDSSLPYCDCHDGG